MTKTFILVFTGMDFPKKQKVLLLFAKILIHQVGKTNFTHWVVKNIPVNINKIEEGENVGEEIKNSWGFKRYSGPKPPNGKHRYFFRLFALKDKELFSKSIIGIKKEIEKLKIGEAVIMGTFG